MIANAMAAAPALINPRNKKMPPMNSSVSSILLLFMSSDFSGCSVELLGSTKIVGLWQFGQVTFWPKIFDTVFALSMNESVSNSILTPQFEHSHLVIMFPFEAGRNWKGKGVQPAHPVRGLQHPVEECTQPHARLGVSVARSF